ncbi:MAG TPA: GntR family transcriptional regulator [Chthoniobacteraceae bacterium]|nr:GntR family transcriptional regulator [Chthoniobacteraceae bacterium]
MVTPHDSVAELPLEKKVAQILFSGSLPPGSKITERDLARNLGLSRIPVREVIAKFVARGVLVRGDKNHSVRMRSYSPDEVTQLYELREALEVASARIACRKATEAELLKMEMICEEMETEVGQYGSVHWASLDRLFHETMVKASRNARFIENFDLLIEECHYVFYLHPARQVRPNPTKEWIEEHMRKVIEDHRLIIDCLRRGDADGVQEQIRAQMRKSALSATRSIVSTTLSKENFTR